MVKDKKPFGVNLDAGLVRELDREVKKGSYLKLSRSEVVEGMLQLLLETVDRKKFSETLRARIIQIRKERAKPK